MNTDLIRPAGNYELRKSYVPSTDEVYINCTESGDWYLSNWDGDTIGSYSKVQWDGAFPNFKVKEMRCRGQKVLKISIRLMQFLQNLRNAYGDTPFNVTSGYRSPAHNATVPGSAKRSFHTMGLAVDVKQDNLDSALFYKLAKQEGFNCFGFYADDEDNFIHLEISHEWEFEDSKGDKAKLLQKPQYVKEKKPASVKKTEKTVAKGAAILAGAPSIINSVGDLNLPVWFLMAGIAVVGVAYGIYWWKNRE